MNHEIRKISKKYIVIILCFIFISIVVFFIMITLRQQKFKEILNDLGHTNVKDILVINKFDIEDPATKAVSNIFKIKFYDNELKKLCVGFIHKKINNTYEEDLECKDKK